MLRPMDSDDPRAIEARLFAEAAGSENGPIFILGAPRTGSTFLYQAICAGFELPFFSNDTNDRFAETPIVGLLRQQGEPPWACLSERSAFGKIEGGHQPSEASAVMKRWFGGGHPSEIVSAGFLPGARDHMRRTVQAAFAGSGAPLVIKNAWNCFRVDAIAEALPNAAFVWIRRDIAAAASSDLHARFRVQGDPNVWNSATPRNVEALRARPYWEQVVENQVAFNRAIRASAARLSPERFLELWHEDVCLDLAGALDRLRRHLPMLAARPVKRLLNVIQEGPGLLSADERRRVADYIETQGARLRQERHLGA